MKVKTWIDRYISSNWIQDEKAKKILIDNGIWVRPFGKLVYIMPPFVITDDELATLCQALLTVVTAYLNQTSTPNRASL